jgi:hypothetical protein
MCRIGRTPNWSLRFTFWGGSLPWLPIVVTSLSITGGIATPVLHQGEGCLASLEWHPLQGVAGLVDALEQHFYQTTVVCAEPHEAVVILYLSVTKKDSQVFGVIDEIVEDPIVLIYLGHLQKL